MRRIIIIGYSYKIVDCANSYREENKKLKQYNQRYKYYDT